MDYANVAKKILQRVGGKENVISLVHCMTRLRFTLKDESIVDDEAVKKTHLEAQVKLSGLAREEFLRSLIMGAQLQARPCTHHADLLHKVAGLCNNANQLAKVANTYGEASRQSVEEMTSIARAVWKEVKENW